MKETIQIHKGESFSRGVFWYIGAGGVFLGLLFLTLYGTKVLGGGDGWVPGWTDVLSAVLFIALCVTYRWYIRKDAGQIVDAQIQEQGLVIGERLHQWHAVQGFGLERKRVDGRLYSIWFQINHEVRVHSLADEEGNVAVFAQALEEYVPFLEAIPMSKFDTFLRRLKI